MKKNVFFALFALAALVFVGCNPDTPTPTPTPDDPTTEGAVITVTPEALLMGVGEEQKLTTTVAPQGTQLQITWTSDNQEVATVNAAGIVTAVAPGTANIIASAEGATADTCVVTVSNDAALDNFVMGGYSPWELGAPIAGTDTLLDLIGLGMTQCQLYEAYFLAWDENVVFDGNSFAGAGYVFEIAAPVYIITQEGEYQGAYINEGYVRIAELPEGVIASCVGTPGELVDLQKYGDAWKAINAFPEEPTDEEIDAAYSLYYDAQVGTQIFMIDFTSGSQSYYLGNVKYALLADDPELGFVYKLKMEWYDYVNEGRLYGLAYDEATETVVEPYDMRVINKEYISDNYPVSEEVAATSTMKIKKVVNFDERTKSIIKETKKMYKK